MPLFHHCLQMAFGPNSTFHTLHTQNSTHHFVLSISCKILPAGIQYIKATITTLTYTLYVFTPHTAS